MPLSVCDNDYLAAFSPHTTLGKLTHLFFCEDFTSQAGKFTVCSAQPLDVPLSPACLVSLGQHTWMPVWSGGRTLSQAARIDNSALCSLSSPHSLLHLSLCGLLGAICGCLAPPAVEGEYCPWDRELLQGQWLQHLSKEEEKGTREGTRFAPAHLYPSSRAAI